jgi:hypothetical protein
MSLRPAANSLAPAGDFWRSSLSRLLWHVPVGCLAAAGRDVLERLPAGYDAAAKTRALV